MEEFSKPASTGIESSAPLSTGIENINTDTGETGLESGTQIESQETHEGAETKEDYKYIPNPEKFEKNRELQNNEIYQPENDIGNGNFSHVFKDPDDNGICYKRLKPGAHRRMNISLRQEAAFMEDVYGIHDVVKSPKMFSSKTKIEKSPDGKTSYEMVIAMEYFENAVTLEDVMDPKKEKFRKEIPEEFDVESFFDNLDDYFETLHEKGIYHRDVAARNILIDLETGDPIVIDFGDAAYESLNERQDAYGQNIYGDTKPEDQDLKKTRQMRNNMIKFMEDNLQHNQK